VSADSRAQAHDRAAARLWARRIAQRLVAASVFQLLLLSSCVSYE